MAGKASTHWPITVTNGATALLNIFLPLVLVRILSPEQVGMYQIFFLYLMLCPGLFLTAGLTNGLYHWAGSYPASKPEIRQSWTLLVAITLTVCSAGILCSRWLAPLIKISDIELYCILLSAPLTLASTFIEDLLIARGSVWTGSLYSSGFNIFKSASILLAAWWTRDVVWVFWAFVGITGIRAIIGWTLLHRTDEIRLMFSKEKTVNVLRYALPVSLAALAGMALGNVDQMILSFRLSPAKFAFYALGCLTIPPLDIFESSVNRILIPRLAKAFTAKDHAESRLLFSEAVSELYRFLLPATVGLVVYAKPIILILFTKRYLPAAHYLQIYALMYVFWSLPFDAVARARGDAKWILRMSLVFAPLSILATWLAAGQWSAMGALIAALGTKISMRLYSLIYDRRSFGVGCSEFLPLKDMAVQTGLVLIAAAGSLLLRPLFSEPRNWFLFTGLLFTLFYFGATYSIKRRQHEDRPGPIPVLELAQTLGLGGLERTMYVIADQLNQSWSFTVRAAAYDQTEGEPSLAAQFQKSSIPIAHWKKGRGFSIRSVWRLVRMIFADRIRILHAHDLGPLIYCSFAKILTLGRVRLVLTIHTLLDIEQNPRYRRYYKFFLRFPNKIIAVSPGIQTGLLALGVSPERIDVIPNGVSFPGQPKRFTDLSERAAFRKGLIAGLTPELYSSRWLLYLARIHPGKGQDVALDVWSSLPQEVRARLALFFVGQETDAVYAQALRRRLLDIPDRERILIVGPSDQPQEWVQLSDLFISGSSHEGMPLAPLEAAGAGLPVLLSDIEGHRFLQPWARYFDPAKPEEGAGRIEEIVRELNSEKETEFFRNRWNDASPLRERWGADAMVASYAKLFQSGES